MKKIVIVTRQLGVGGVETSLINMINKIPKYKYKVTILTVFPGGELLEKIPYWVEVRVIPGINRGTILKVLDNLKRLEIKKSFNILKYSILTKKAKTISESYEYSCNTLPDLEDEYDLAISYYNPTAFSVVYTINKIRAKRKVMWIHNDVNLYKDIYEYEKFYEQYDKIFNVSEVGANEFISKFPKIKNKVSVFYNLIDETIVKHRANNKVLDDNYDGITLVTVARLSYEKGQDMIPEITRNLIDNGKKIRWYCIGEGSFRETIEENIQRYNVSESVILLGNKENPFPYINECDIYVQTSRSECYCTTVMEAKCLKKPMIITEVNGSREQIKNGKDGIIVNFNVEEIYNAIINLIENKEIRESFIKELKKTEINTNNEINKLLNII